MKSILHIPASTIEDLLFKSAEDLGFKVTSLQIEKCDREEPGDGKNGVFATITGELIGSEKITTEKSEPKPQVIADCPLAGLFPVAMGIFCEDPKGTRELIRWGSNYLSMTECMARYRLETATKTERSKYWLVSFTPEKILFQC